MELIPHRNGDYTVKCGRYRLRITYATGEAKMVKQNRATKQRNGVKASWGLRRLESSLCNLSWL